MPAVSPLKTDFKIDEGAVERMFSHFSEYQIHPFILGTTGESASLSANLKADYLRYAAKYRRTNVMLYSGISSNCLQESLEFARQCADFGVDALAATIPSYYALSDAQVLKYFETLANELPLPLIIYNIPATTHYSIPLNLIDELSFHPNIIAIKDSERSEERLSASLERWKNREDFSHFLGWAAKSDFALINGSDGLIPSTGNLMPAIYSKMWQAAAKGDEAQTKAMQKWSDAFGGLYQSNRTLGESLWALKVLMQHKGLCQQTVMPPLTPQQNPELLIQNFGELLGQVNNQLDYSNKPFKKGFK